MSMVPTATKDAHRLFREGSRALAIVETNGMRVDVDLMDRTIKEVGEKIAKLTAKLKTTEVWRIWKRRWGERSNLGSRSQLATVLFDVMGHEAKEKTETGRDRVDVKSLEKVDLPFVRHWVRVEKLKKLRSTYLVGIRREVVDGLLHPSFNLHLVRTYRSSCDSPNFQNIPIRDPEIGKLIRSCFVPRDGHVLVEIDYGALEFRIYSCWCGDKRMIEYASNSALDIHRDMAAECYLMSTKQVTKQARFYAKNQFVFPTLYGSYFCNTSRDLWGAIESANLETADGMPLYEHLSNQKIFERGRCNPKDSPEPHTFERHIQDVEKEFNKKFPEWSKWKDKWLEQYRKRGWFQTMTGFVCAGTYSRNELYNYPVQGPAFHCLLWSLTRLVQQLKTRKMKSLVVGQIHDSIVADVAKEELSDYLALAKQIMTIDVRKHWSWIVTPLVIEADVAEDNWFNKKPVEVS